MYRKWTSGLLTFETKTPTCEGWRFAIFAILGGPGRNRTTDTRIFNPNKYAKFGVDQYSSA
jgi:hypothetical protein